MFLPTAKIPEKNYYWDIFLISSFFLLIYSLWLGSYPLFTPDEARYSGIARAMVASGDYITPKLNGVPFLDKPILYYWLQALAIAIFGIKEWAIRLFPVLLGIVGIATTYLCGRSIFNRSTGFLAAIILGSLPLYFVGTHYANLDLEVAVFISMTLLCFITAIHDKAHIKTRFLYSAYIFSACAFLTKGLMGIAFPAMIIGMFILTLNRWVILKKIQLVKGLLIFSALTFPWYALVQLANPDFLHYFFVKQQVHRFLSSENFNNQTPVWFYLPVLLIGIYPWTIFLYHSLRYALEKVYNNISEHEADYFLLLWISIIFIFFSIPHSTIITYILPIFPAIALLIASYLSSLTFMQTKQRLFFSLFVLLNFLLAACLYLITHYKQDRILDLLSLSNYFILYFLALSLFGGILLRQSIKLLIILCFFASASVLLILTANAKYLNQNTATPLINILKSKLTNEDIIVNYYKFYYDVPIYLEKNINVVANWDAQTIVSKDNWLRELWYGKQSQNNSLLMTNEKFLDLWQGNKRVFVFLNDNYFAQFKKDINTYHFISKYNDIILLSNERV